MTEQANTARRGQPRRQNKTNARAALSKPRPPSARELRADVVARGEPIAYRIREVLTQLGIGRTKLYDIIGSGALPAYSHNGVTLIMRADLEAYISDPAKRLPVRTQKAPQ